MSPRPRKVSDDELFEATLRVMQRVPAGELTLAQVGAEAGLTASAVVQRFGSKRELLRAVNARYADGATRMLAGIRAAAPSPVAAFREYAACLAPMVESPETLAHHLGYLQVDLSDPQMFAYLREAYRATRDVLAHWASEAVAAGELRPGADPQAVAALVQGVVNGATLTVPILGEGAPAERLRQAVDLALAPYLA